MARRSLRVIRNEEEPMRLVFCNPRSAQDFRRFVQVYISDHGPGNGYNAFWMWQPRNLKERCLLWLEERRCRWPAKRQWDDHDRALVANMALNISASRLARPFSWDGPAMSEEEAQGYLKSIFCDKLGNRLLFCFEEDSLPPRLRPAANDLVRIVDNPDFDRELGRVTGLSADGQTVSLRPVLNQPSLEELTLPIGQVMKINDFLEGCSSWSERRQLVQG